MVGDSVAFADAASAKAVGSMSKPLIAKFPNTASLLQERLGQLSPFLLGTTLAI
jgi:hypothetical protein